MPKKIKILYVISKAFWGGAQRYVFDLATHLPRKTFDIVVVAGGEGELLTKLTQHSIGAIQLPLKNTFDPFGDLTTLFHLIRIFKKEKPDIIHSNSSKIGLLAGLAGRLMGVPKLFFTAHGWPSNEDRPWIVRMLFFFLSWLTVLLNHKVICVADAVRDAMKRFPGTEHKLITIHNGIGEEFFVSKEAARGELQKFLPAFLKNAAVTWIGTIAELTKNKGLIYLIHAISLFKDPHAICLIVGEGKMRKKLEALIQEKHLEERVFLVGRKEKASRLLKAFDLFILPSVKETFSYSLLEASLAEIPIIATDVGGNPEIVKNGITGLIVPPRDRVMLSMAIKKMLQNPQVMENYARNARAWVESRFAFEEMLRKTQKIYGN